MTTKTMDMRLIAIAIAAIIVCGGFTWLALSAPPGWENVVGQDYWIVNGERVDVGSSTNIYGSGYAEPAVANFKIDDGESWSGWESLPRYSGSTAVVYSLSGPTHVSWNFAAADWVADQTDDMPFQQYTKTVGDVEYIYDHHVYEVDLLAKTAGESILSQVLDRYMGTCDGLPSADVARQDPATGETLTMSKDQDHTADFRVFVLMSLKPWEIYTGLNTTINATHYTHVTDAFYGIMGASVIAVNMGWVAEEAPEAPTGGQLFKGLVHSDLQKGYQLNLYSAEESSLGVGWYGNVDDGDSAVLGDISGIPTALMFEVSGQIEPGLVVAGTNYWSSATPAQRFLQIRVRVDILTAMGVVLVSGAQPTGTTQPTGIEDPPVIRPWWADISDFFKGLGEFWSNPFNLIIMAAIVGGVFLVIWVLRPRRK